MVGRAHAQGAPQTAGAREHVRCSSRTCASLAYYTASLPCPAAALVPRADHLEGNHGANQGARSPPLPLPTPRRVDLELHLGREHHQIAMLRSVARTLAKPGKQALRVCVVCSLVMRRPRVCVVLSGCSAAAPLVYMSSTPASSDCCSLFPANAGVFRQFSAASSHKYEFATPFKAHSKPLPEIIFNIFC
jgi:hypothetical protein